jgi:hypothetical protein
MLTGTPRTANPSSFQKAPVNDLFEVNEDLTHERVFLILIFYFQCRFFVNRPFTNPIW